MRSASSCMDTSVPEPTLRISPGRARPAMANSGARAQYFFGWNRWGRGGYLSSRAAREFLIALWILVAVSPSAAGAVVAIAAPGFERPGSPPRLEPATPGAQ